MNLNHLQYFLETCRYGSITKASEVCHISQPSITAAINNLEKELGAKLFDRVNNRLRLTVVGEGFKDLTEEFLKTFDDYCQSAYDIASSRYTKIRVGIPPFLSTIITKKLFPEFSVQHPNIRLEVVQRLYDSQFGGQGVDDIAKYIKLGKLGEAFSSDEQVVLLIDEIDKADLEFPNDLLWELDKMEFYIPETKETIKAKQRPIVVITSNAEKELPDAFLRRCVFHYIEFPDQAQMEAILRVHFDNLEEKLIKQSLAAFYRLRELRGIEKKPSTSELVDWIRALVAGDVDPKLIEDNMPFAGVLLKKDKDLQTLRKQKR